VDLAIASSVEFFLERILIRYSSRLQVLVNSAAVINAAKHVTVDGIEMMFVWAYYKLMDALLPMLARNGPSAIVNVASGVAYYALREGSLKLNDLDFVTRNFEPWTAYAQSKAADLLLTWKASRIASGQVMVNAVHPGVLGFCGGVTTSGLRATLTSFPKEIQKSLVSSCDVNATTASARAVWLATQAPKINLTASWWVMDQKSRLSVRMPLIWTNSSWEDDLWERCADLATSPLQTMRPSLPVSTRNPLTAHPTSAAVEDTALRLSGAWLRGDTSAQRGRAILNATLFCSELARGARHIGLDGVLKAVYSRHYMVHVRDDEAGFSWAMGPHHIVGAWSVEYYKAFPSFDGNGSSMMAHILDAHKIAGASSVHAVIWIVLARADPEVMSSSKFWPIIWKELELATHCVGLAALTMCGHGIGHGIFYHVARASIPSAKFSACIMPTYHSMLIPKASLMDMLHKCDTAPIRRLAVACAGGVYHSLFQYSRAEALGNGAEWFAPCALPFDFGEACFAMFFVQLYIWDDMEDARYDSQLADDGNGLSLTNMASLCLTSDNMSWEVTLACVYGQSRTRALSFNTPPYALYLSTVWKSIWNTSLILTNCNYSNEQLHFGTQFDSSILSSCVNATVDVTFGLNPYLDRQALSYFCSQLLQGPWDSLTRQKCFRSCLLRSRYWQHPFFG